MAIIEWDTQARDFLRKLPKEIAQRIFSKNECEALSRDTGQQKWL